MYYLYCNLLNKNVKEGVKMKTLIVYSSKYGTTRKCAELLKKQVNADLHCCDCKAVVNIENYDQIVLGTSVYMGLCRKNMRKFINKNIVLLSTKKIATFICSKESDNFEKLFSPLMLNDDTLKARFGYELFATKMRGLDKFVTKKIAGDLKDVHELDEQTIVNFGNTLLSM